MMVGVQSRAELCMMRSTPLVLSTGKRAMGEEFCYMWIMNGDPGVITPVGGGVPSGVLDRVPYCGSNDFQRNCRDHFTNCKDRSGIAANDESVEVTARVGSQGAVACWGALQPKPSDSLSSAEGFQAEEAVHCLPRGASSSKLQKDEL